MTLQTAPFTGSVTARRLLALLDEHGWVHVGREWGVDGTFYVYYRPWQRGQREMLQILLDDTGHWSFASWWTYDHVVLIRIAAANAFWGPDGDAHFREPSRFIDRFRDLVAVITRPRCADFPTNQTQEVSHA